MPPSSPTTKMPGVAVWKSGPMRGISTPRRSVPSTSVIASYGQAVWHAPWPMQFAAFTSTALPATIPSTSCSGHAVTQAPQPRQRLGEMSGWSETGWSRPASRAACSASTLRASERRRMRDQIANVPASGTR